MYIPPHNRGHERAKLLAFVRAYSFGTLVTAHDASPKATHLPFVVEEDSETVRLIAHMAKANDQWRDFADGERVLAIFQEPHAYISPRLYEQPLSVPTWNYVAVHAYGHVRVRDSRDDKLAILTRLIRQSDEAYLTQFAALPSEFVDAKLKGIVAFEIKVSEWQARFKLSQDRTPTERENIIHALSAEPDQTRATVGQMMAERSKP